MGGTESRQGFRFQDLVLADRVLEELINKRAALIMGLAPAASKSYHTEAPLPGGTGPDWDSIDVTSQATLLEEVKSGAVDADDRRTLWKRVRATYAAVAPGAKVVVRLTVNSESPPAQLDYWKALPSLGATATATKHERVTSAQRLADEALYWLTVTDPDLPAPLNLAAARQILADFELNDSYGETQVRASVDVRLALLHGGFATNQMVKLVRGFLGDRAESTVPAQHTFTADDLLFELEALRNLSTVDPAAARLWRDLSTGSTNEGIVKAELAQGLAYREWRGVQPQLASLLNEATFPLIALLGRGGLGKTVMLRHLYEEQRANHAVLWVPADRLRGCDPNQLAAALDLGSFLARIEHRELHVFIDALEEAASDTQARAAIVAALTRVAASSRLHLVATSRVFTWRELRGTQAALEGWREAELQEWSEQTVSDELTRSRRAQVGHDLKRLLRTPLLLDLFLRTFSVGEDIPEGLQSRHGLLLAYWERRVLPRDNPRSSLRAAALDAASAAEVSGSQRHSGDGDGVRDLVSEGVFISERGRHLFRHALLREFAVMSWLADESRSLPDLLMRLQAIGAPMLQYGVLRALVEASLDSSPGAHGRWNVDLRAGSVLPAVLPSPLAWLLADVLGELDDPSSIDPAPLSNVLNGGAEPDSVVRRVVRVSSFAVNHAWLSWWARLPATAAFTETTPWLTGPVLRDLAGLVEVSWRELERGGATAPPSSHREVAERLRIWAAAPSKRAWLVASDGMDVLPLIEAITAVEPSDATAQWLLGLPRTWRTAPAILRRLPRMVENAKRIGVTVAPSGIVTLYLHAAGYEWAQGLLTPVSGVVQFSHGEYARVQGALLGQGTKAPGLLSALPCEFLPIAFGLFLDYARAAKERVQSFKEGILRRSGKEEQELEAELRRIFQPPSAELQACEERLAALCEPKLSPEDAMGTLIDDVPFAYYRHRAHEARELIDAVHDWIAANLSDDGARIRTCYVPALTDSRSALARLLLLDVLLSQDGWVSYVDIIDPILLDHRIYHIPAESMRWWIGQGITRRWAEWTQDQRDQVLANLDEIRRSPFVNAVYGFAPLLACVPEGDRPPPLRAFEEVYTLRGRTPRLENPRREAPEAEVSPVDPAQLFDETVPKEALAGDARARWRHFRVRVDAVLPQGEPVNGERQGPDQAGVEACVGLFRELIRAHLPEAVDAAQHVWMFESLRGFIERMDQLPKAEGEESWLTDEDVALLRDWLVASMASVSDETLRSEYGAIQSGDMWMEGSNDLWLEALFLADELMSTPTGARDSQLVAVLRPELMRALRDAPPGRIARMAHRLRPDHWRRVGDETLRQLHQALRRLRHGGALRWTFPLLVVLPGDARDDLITFWLAEVEYPSFVEGPRFAEDLGVTLGGGALSHGQGATVSWKRTAVERFLSTRPESGLAADDATYRSWIKGVVFGAKELLRYRLQHGADMSTVQDFVSLMTQVWDAMVSLERSETEAGRDFFSLFVHHAMEAALERLPPPQTHIAWGAIQPLYARVIAEGEWAEVDALVFELAELKVVQSIGSRVLFLLLERLGERLTQLSSEQARGGIAGASMLLDSTIRLSQLVATQEGVDSDVRDGIVRMLQRWAGPPIEHPGAARVLLELRRGA